MMQPPSPEPLPVITGEKLVIPYESPDRKRLPRWAVRTLVVLYLLLMAAVLFAPAWIGSLDLQEGIVSAGAMAILIFCGMGLMIMPVRNLRRRPSTRRSILVPICSSGILAGALMLGTGIALVQLLAPATSSPYYTHSPPIGKPDGYTTDHTATRSAMLFALFSPIAVWLAWSVIFALIAWRGDANSLGMRMHRSLIAGSALELVVAVSAHIIVRRRGDCCGSIYTGTAICIGILVALVSFGPTVLLLYHNRCKQIRIG